VRSGARAGAGSRRFRKEGSKFSAPNVPGHARVGSTESPLVVVQREGTFQPSRRGHAFRGWYLAAVKQYTPPFMVVTNRSRSSPRPDLRPGPCCTCTLKHTCGIHEMCNCLKAIRPFYALGSRHVQFLSQPGPAPAVIVYSTKGEDSRGSRSKGGAGRGGAGRGGAGGPGVRGNGRGPRGEGPGRGPGAEGRGRRPGERGTARSVAALTTSLRCRTHRRTPSAPMASGTHQKAMTTGAAAGHGLALGPQRRHRLRPSPLPSPAGPGGAQVYQEDGGHNAAVHRKGNPGRPPCASHKKHVPAVVPTTTSQMPSPLGAQTSLPAHTQKDPATHPT